MPSSSIKSEQAIKALALNDSTVYAYYRQYVASEDCAWQEMLEKLVGALSAEKLAYFEQAVDIASQSTAPIHIPHNDPRNFPHE